MDDKLTKSVELLRQALKDLNSVPNRKYCENYRTAEKITTFLKELEEDEQAKL